MTGFHSMESGRLIGLVGILGLAAFLSACGGSGGKSPPGPPPTLTLTANPASIVTGLTSTLTWATTNATGCTASQGWTGSRSASGSEAVGPLTATTTYTLVCSGTSGSVSRSVTVTVTPPVAPTVTLTATPSSILPGESAEMEWSSTDATECTASGGWTGTRATSGIEQVGPLASTTSFTLTCTGPGGTGTQTVPVAVGAAVVVSGLIEFERVPFNATAGQGLDIDTPVVQPARQVVVEAVDPNTGGRFGQATTTDDNGNYSLVVPGNTNMVIRARAEMVKAAAAPTWLIRVLNNTNDNALYVMDGAAFNSGTSSSTRNLRALTGWNGTSYVNADRVAAPFAILDSVYSAVQLIASADSATEFPPLDVYWSPTNRPTVTTFCTQDGQIGTTFYTNGANALDAGNCTPSIELPGGIYVLGDYANGNGDTDEFDQHVIAHEFGHYVEDNFSRSDSIGGEHVSGDHLDMRVAFGEGWGNAYSGMVLDDPLYRDSFSGVDVDGGFDLETDSPTKEGWFSEASIGEILWDLFDVGNDDPLALGFAPIYSVMTGAQADTEALTSIFSFAAALKSERPADAAAINALLGAESISNSDAFGNNETDADGSPSAIPLYIPVTLNTPVTQPICSSATFGVGNNSNKLGNRRYLRLTLANASVVTIVASGFVAGAGTVAATDPDIYVFSAGLVETSLNVGATETLSQRPFAAGTHIIEVHDFDLAATSLAPRCMTVSVTGT